MELAYRISVSCKVRLQLVRPAGRGDAGELENKANSARWGLTELGNMCEKKGLSKVGNKNELRKRLESLEDGSEEGLRVIKWKKRGRKVATRPSETVFEEHSESDDEEPNEYHNQKKAELRQECLTRNLPASGSNKILIKRLLENDLLVKKMQNDHLDKLCESCEENPIKLHKSCISKWYCSDCEQYICNICKSAHEKL